MGSTFSAFSISRRHLALLFTFAVLYVIWMVWFTINTDTPHALIASNRSNSNNHVTRGFSCIHCHPAGDDPSSSPLLCDAALLHNTSDDARLVSDGWQLILDSNNLAHCPIHPLDAFYADYGAIAAMLESERSIFEQISVLEHTLDLSAVRVPLHWSELSLDVQTQFTLHNRSARKDFYLSNANANARANTKTWEKQFIEDLVSGLRTSKPQLRAEYTFFNYKRHDAQAFLTLLNSDKYQQAHIAGAHAIVVGSETPWLEVMLLASGVATVTTSEYSPITMEHPQMHYIHPKDLTAAHTNRYDIAVSYSSLEHAGLGRYGDPIHPFLDVLYVNQLSCLVKPNGLFFFGVPTSADALAWNAHRYYGPKRLHLLLMQWRIVDVVGHFNFKRKFIVTQPWFVLQNKRGCYRG